MGTLAEPMAAPQQGPHGSQSGDSRAGARRIIALLAAINVVIFAAYVVASYGFARHAPFGTPEPLEAAALDRLASSLAFMGPGIGALLGGESALSDPGTFFVGYALFLAIPVLVFVFLLGCLARYRLQLEQVIADALYRWAVVFAVLLAFAHPVLVQDFWLSAGWGRLVAQGVNPYYVNLDPGVTAGLPLDYLGLLMTYGPLWAIVSGIVMKVAGGSAVIAGALFKVVLALAWIGSLAMVRRLLRTRPAADQCVGLAIAGWLPLGVMQIVAEGHNDGGMVFLILLWLVLIERGRTLAATGALAASVLIKYLSAPMFLLDLLHLVRSRGGRLIGYWPHAAVAASITVAVMAVFFRSPGFFASTAHMADWHFFTPRDAVVALGRLAGIEPSLGSLGGVVVVAMALTVQGFFLVVLALGLIRYVRHPGVETFRYAALAVTAGMLFGVVGHVWPWFLAWGVLVAALHPAARLTRWMTGVALAMPFPLLYWVVYPGAEQFTVVTPPLYLFALAWFVLTPRRWFGAAG
ncbi:MAG: hypothetical protein ACR2HZ_03625 [Gemmatimonadaceae bacterium]